MQHEACIGLHTQTCALLGASTPNTGMVQATTRTVLHPRLWAIPFVASTDLHAAELKFHITAIKWHVGRQGGAVAVALDQ